MFKIHDRPLIPELFDEFHATAEEDKNYPLSQITVVCKFAEFDFAQEMEILGVLVDRVRDHLHQAHDPVVLDGIVGRIKQINTLLEMLTDCDDPSPLTCAVHEFKNWLTHLECRALRLTGYQVGRLCEAVDEWTNIEE
jgi:hypothetical protein